MIGPMRQRLIDVGFVVGIAICAGVLLAIAGAAWLVLGGSYEERE
jgi:hypothetical protein